MLTHLLPADVGQFSVALQSRYPSYKCFLFYFLEILVLKFFFLKNLNFFSETFELSFFSVLLQFAFV